MNISDWIAICIGVATFLGGVIGWLAIQIWNSKPSKSDMLVAIAAAIDLAHEDDKETDSMLLRPLEKDIRNLEQKGDDRHKENVKRFDKQDDKLDEILLVISKKANLVT